MRNFKVAVIGGGFSGLCAAVKLGKVFNEKLLVLEANKRVGKKILATGNGQGNLTNADVRPEFYHGDRAFAARALEKYSNAEILEFFEKLGVIITLKNGRYYPASEFAGTICDGLRFAADACGVTVVTETVVTCVEKTNGGFVIKTKNGAETYFAEKVILATGGASGAGFFTDGKSYALAKNLGHTLTPLRPSLVQIKTEREKIRGLKGVKTDAKVALYDDKRHIREFFGDVLFTDYGVSGNAVFAISAYLGDCRSPKLKIEFLPEFTREELTDKLTLAVKNLEKENSRESKNENKVSLERACFSLLPSRLTLAVIKAAGYSPAAAADEKAIAAVCAKIKKFELNVEGTVGFDCSQVTAGGIKTAEISDDMQSKLNKGLYIIGEELNVDGDCGGYNLQWAFTSASVCADAIIAEMKNNKRG